MSNVNQIFGIKEQRQNMSSPSRQSMEATEDYAIKKVVYTQELIVGGVNITSGVSAHTPTIYRGSDFTGVNPVRVLTHSRTLPASVLLVIGGRVMYRDLEYTISGNQITMVDMYVDDEDYVMVCD